MPVYPLVRDQEVEGSNPSAPTNPFNNFQVAGAKTAHPFTHPHRVAWRIEGTYTAAMADNATTTFESGLPAEGDRSPLGEPIDFDVRGLGRRLLGTDAREGWIKKIERRREGKVWVGFFHLWSTDANGRRVRQKKEKTLGPASMQNTRHNRSWPSTSKSTPAGSQNKATRSPPLRICGTRFAP